MIWLLLSILSFSAAMLLFKYFEKAQINTLPAIVINYFIAAICGLVVNGDVPNFGSIIHQTWFYFAMVIGCMFIILFNIIAFTAQNLGVSVATVANKMSVIIPVTAAVILYNDSINAVKVIGILLALTAVYLSSINQGGAKSSKRLRWLPLLIFISSGILDVIFNYVQQKHLSPENNNLFIYIVFLFAGCLGLLYMIIRRIHFKLNDILGGIALGIPNYGSIFFLILALQTKGVESSVAFPINNMGIVMFSTLGAFFIFKEKLRSVNWVGIFLAVISIAIISFS